MNGYNIIAYFQIVSNTKYHIQCSTSWSAMGGGDNKEVVAGLFSLVGKP